MFCFFISFSPFKAEKRNKSGEGIEYAGSEDNETKPSAQIDLENTDVGGAEEEAVDGKCLFHQLKKVGNSINLCSKIIQL